MNGEDRGVRGDQAFPSRDVEVVGASKGPKER